jgi:peptidoglycan/xylan/chitin deacetylase (PgdA/CDA1 family)
MSINDYKIKVKRILAQILYSSGLNKRLILKKSRREFLILMYHRVIFRKKINSTIQPGMFVTPQTFEMHLKFLKKNFNILPLSYIKNLNNINSSDRPVCFITFDDGWKDFYNYAYPLIVHYSAYATVFLPTSFVGTDKMFWTDKFLNLYAQYNKRKINIVKKFYIHNPVIREIDRLKGGIDSKKENAIEILKRLRSEEIMDVLKVLEEITGKNNDIHERHFLNWDEIEEIKESGFIEFGSHSVNHRIMNTLNDDEIIGEVVESKNTIIEKKVNSKDFYAFCYPNGVFNDSIVEIVKSAGYDAAVTTEKGWNNLNCDLYKLKRIGIHDDVTSSKAKFSCRISEYGFF